MILNAQSQTKTEEKSEELPTSAFGEGFCGKSITCPTCGRSFSEARRDFFYEFSLFTTGESLNSESFDIQGFVQRL